MSNPFVAKPKSVNDPNLLPFRFALKAYINEEKLRIPVLPDIVAQVMQLINNPSVNANTLARLIHKDQALAGYVLRVSNSPMYAGTKEILTLRQAIARIGARTLGKIALSITMRGEVFKADGYEDLMATIWRQSLACGALAQEVGKAVQYNSETLYLCGLLHTVGKPVILQALDILKGELKLELSYEGGLALIDEFHQDVGGRVAEQWKLPDAVKKAALHYHDPSVVEQNQKEVLITYSAHQLSMLLDAEPEEQSIEQFLTDPHFQSIRLDQKALELLVSRLEKIKELLDAMKM
ncbi:MAG: HDOD domain-containing protein [Rhodothermaceae bacterium]|nr:HDOD domain-containing protein [Rhodothermaceae bacterium]